MQGVDQLSLNFNEQGLFLLNIVLGLIMFGISLDLKIADFRRVLKKPLAPVLGLTGQFLLLPALTYLLTRVMNISASLALGMILVSACPGGNLSNFITHLSKGNTALSVSMTAVSTVIAILMTPFNLAFWGGMHPTAAQIITDVNLNPAQVLLTVFMILGVPLTLGLYVSHRYTHLALKLKKPFKYASIIFFIVFVGVAFAANWQNFLQYIHYAAAAIILHNAVALGIGYSMGRIARLGDYNARALSIETGIQNSGLGLILIFNFFDGLGGMALIAAGWGIWHVISGLTLAFFWSRNIPAELKTQG